MNKERNKLSAFQSGMKERKRIALRVSLFFPYWTRRKGERMAYDQVVPRRAKMKISSRSRLLFRATLLILLFPRVLPTSLCRRLQTETLILFPGQATLGFVVETSGFVEVPVTGSRLDPVKRSSPSFLDTRKKEGWIYFKLTWIIFIFDLAQVLQLF